MERNDPLERAARYRLLMLRPTVVLNNDRLGFATLIVILTTADRETMGATCSG